MTVGPGTQTRGRSWIGTWPFFLALGVVVALLPSSLEAQEGVGVGAAVIQPSPFPIDTLPAESPSPVSGKGAFIRSLLIPGWGQVASGAITRGGFYFVAQSASFWMIRKSALARGEATSFTEVEREIATARLLASGVNDPFELQAGVDADGEVRKWEDLRELRGQQVEDWVALSIFLALLGAADAVVAAHLQDYPEPLAFRVIPSRMGDRIELGFALPVGGVAR